MNDFKYLLILMLFLNTAVAQNYNAKIFYDNNNVHKIRLSKKKNDNAKMIQHQLQVLLDRLIYDDNNNARDNYEAVYYNNFTAFSSNVYAYVNNLIKCNIIKYSKDIEGIWNIILAENAKKIKDNKIGFYKINSIQEIMNYYVSLRINLIREQIDKISKIDDLFYFEREYNDLINTFIWAQEIFLTYDSIKIINYIIQQFIFKRNEIIPHVIDLINKVNLSDELSEYEIPLFTNKAQYVISNLTPFHIEDIINETKNELNKFSNHLDYVLYYIKNNNNFAKQCIKNYIKECISIIKSNDSTRNDKNTAHANLQKVIQAVKTTKCFSLFYRNINKELELEKLINDYNPMARLEDLYKSKSENHNLTKLDDKRLMNVSETFDLGSKNTNFFNVY